MATKRGARPPAAPKRKQIEVEQTLEDDTLPGEAELPSLRAHAKLGLDWEDIKSAYPQLDPIQGELLFKSLKKGFVLLPLFVLQFFSLNVHLISNSSSKNK